MRDHTMAAYAFVTNDNIIIIVRMMAHVIAKLKYDMMVTMVMSCRSNAAIQVMMIYII